MADGFEQPLAARLAHPPLAHSGEHQIKRLAPDAQERTPTRKACASARRCGTSTSRVHPAVHASVHAMRACMHVRARTHALHPSPFAAAVMAAGAREAVGLLLNQPALRL
eukprot:418519-Prymnesium_polylepis.3